MMEVNPETFPAEKHVAPSLIHSAVTFEGLETLGGAVSAGVPSGWRWRRSAHMQQVCSWLSLLLCSHTHTLPAEPQPGFPRVSALFSG